MTEEDQQRLLAAQMELEQLRRDFARVSRVVAGLQESVAEAKRDAKDAKELAEDIEDDVEELQATPSGGSVGRSLDMESELGGMYGPSPHAFQVMVDGDGKVQCYIPKAPDGTFFPAAMGGKHLGASEGETAEEHAGPYPAGGQGSSSDPEAPWAHYGWYEVGTINTESGQVNDKIVLATFTVPLDPENPEDSDSDEVEGPSLESVTLVDASGWKDICAKSWVEFDNAKSGSVTRQVAIALVANGLVTQLTMTPFLDTAGAGDDWHADSEEKIYESIDPPSVMPEWETEEEDQSKDVVVGKDIQGQPIIRTITVKVTKVKKDPNTGERIQKKDQQGNPIFQKTKYHQVHNFDSGNDNGLVEYADANNYGGTQVACRIPSGNGAEIMWRRIPLPPEGSDSDSDDDCVPEYEIEKTSSSGACTDEYKLKRTDCQGGVTYPGDTIEVPKPPTYQLSGASASSGCATTISLSQIPCGGSALPAGSVDIPNPKTYTISSGGSSGCVERSYKLMETNCSGSSSVGASIDIPKPPEYSLVVSGGSCSKTVSLTKTPCGGSASQAGDSFSFEVPPSISASATGLSGGALAGTVYITPCGGSATQIPIYNGKDGAPGSQGPQGCTPEISVTVLEPGSTQGGEAGGELVTIKNKEPDGAGGCQTRETLTFVVKNGKSGSGGCSPVVSANTDQTITSGGRVLAGTIQGMSAGSSGCEAVSGALIHVYNGKDAELSGHTGSYFSLHQVRTSSCLLQMRTLTPTWENGLLKQTGSWSEWATLVNWNNVVKTIDSLNISGGILALKYTDYCGTQHTVSGPSVSSCT